MMLMKETYLLHKLLQTKDPETAIISYISQNDNAFLNKLILRQARKHGYFMSLKQYFTEEDNLDMFAKNTGAIVYYEKQTINDLINKKIFDADTVKQLKDIADTQKEKRAIVALIEHGYYLDEYLIPVYKRLSNLEEAIAVAACKYFKTHEHDAYLYINYLESIINAKWSRDIKKISSISRIMYLPNFRTRYYNNGSEKIRRAIAHKGYYSCYYIKDNDVITREYAAVYQPHIAIFDKEQSVFMKALSKETATYVIDTNQVQKIMFPFWFKTYVPNTHIIDYLKQIDKNDSILRVTIEYFLKERPIDVAMDCYKYLSDHINEYPIDHDDLEIALVQNKECNDKEMIQRQSVDFRTLLAMAGIHLDIFSEDPLAKVRIEVAKQGAYLHKLINDRSKYVLFELIKHRYALQHLRQHKNKEVREEVLKITNRANVTYPIYFCKQKRPVAKWSPAVHKVTYNKPE